MDDEVEFVDGGPELIDVLIVEDNRGDAVLLQKRIERKFPSFEVKHVMSFRDAAKALKKYKFTLVFLDLNLPDDFGIETVRDIRAIADDIYLVAVTGLAGDLTIREAKKAGADEVHVKAYLDDDAIISIVEAAEESMR